MPSYSVGADGSFDFKVSASRIGVSAEIGSPRHGSVTLPIDALDGRPIPLVAVRRLRGHLLFSDGSPVKGAVIAASAAMSAESYQYQPQTLGGVTDSAGRFAFDGYDRPTTWVVTVAGLVRGFPAWSNDAEFPDNLEVVIPKGGSVRGRVTHRGEPVANANVRAFSVNHGAVFTVCDSSGSFQFVDLPPARFQIATSSNFSRVYSSSVEVLSGEEALVLIEGE